MYGTLIRKQSTANEAFVAVSRSNQVFYVESRAMKGNIIFHQPNFPSFYSPFPHSITPTFVPSAFQILMSRRPEEGTNS
jgi:hypothetical protein